MTERRFQNHKFGFYTVDDLQIPLKLVPCYIAFPCKFFKAQAVIDFSSVMAPKDNPEFKLGANMLINKTDERHLVHIRNTKDLGAELRNHRLVCRSPEVLLDRKYKGKGQTKEKPQYCSGFTITFYTEIPAEPSLLLTVVPMVLIAFLSGQNWLNSQLYAPEDNFTIDAQPSDGGYRVHADADTFKNADDEVGDFMSNALAIAIQLFVMLPEFRSDSWGEDSSSRLSVSNKMILSLCLATLFSSIVWRYGQGAFVIRMLKDSARQVFGFCATLRAFAERTGLSPGEKVLDWILPLMPLLLAAVVLWCAVSIAIPAGVQQCRQRVPGMTATLVFLLIEMFVLGLLCYCTWQSSSRSDVEIGIHFERTTHETIIALGWICYLYVISFVVANYLDGQAIARKLSLSGGVPHVWNAAEEPYGMKYVRQAFLNPDKEEIEKIVAKHPHDDPSKEVDKVLEKHKFKRWKGLDSREHDEKELLKLNDFVKPYTGTGKEFELNPELEHVWKDVADKHDL